MTKKDEARVRKFIEDNLRDAVLDQTLHSSSIVVTTPADRLFTLLELNLEAQSEAYCFAAQKLIDMAKDLIEYNSYDAYEALAHWDLNRPIKNPIGKD